MKQLLVAIPLLLAACDKAHDHGGHDHGATPAAGMARDLVCKMEVPKAAAKKAEFDKADYFFCSDDCLKRFNTDPAKFAAACACARTMKNCDCEHCTGKREPCDCGHEKK